MTPCPASTLQTCKISRAVSGGRPRRKPERHRAQGSASGAPPQARGAPHCRQRCGVQGGVVPWICWRDWGPSLRPWGWYPATRKGARGRPAAPWSRFKPRGPQRGWDAAPQGLRRPAPPGDWRPRGAWREGGPAFAAAAGGRGRAGSGRGAERSRARAARPAGRASGCASEPGGRRRSRGPRAGP